ncbi:hypothetical protein [Candidatus Soleaferrea massiliensis]|uniref:hypothetical protein n=1 Tax=Candidatus Soleaferrea massiliensis TaxID=1470354 RepID=UPI00058EA45E|nr:hypothetical protein [Candidatus Soleaferrea massiliensis]
MPRRSRQWTRLDNAAKIFPSNSTKHDTKVFRFACELYETVDPAVLQQALDKTIELFPNYRCILKRGLFWYYLEQSDLKPMVQKENKPPCSEIYDKNVKTLLFEVSFYHRRINLEVYHALSDGTGALQFLRMLVFHYLTKMHADRFPEELPQMDYDASDRQKMDDSFSRYYAGKNDKAEGKEKHRVAYKLRGARLPENRIRVIEGIMPVKEVIRAAHAHHATLTVFLCAVLVQAIREEMTVRELSKPVVLTVPVNLRNYFDSQSARNFFSVINVCYDFNEQPEAFADIVTHLAGHFKEELTNERMQERLNELFAIEKNPFARIAPLALKDLCLKIAHDYTNREITAAFSNIGKVDMPEALREYIRLFDVFVSTDRLQICMCSFEENLTLSFTSPFVGADVQRRFFRTLTTLGVPVEVVTSRLDQE